MRGKDPWQRLGFLSRKKMKLPTVRNLLNLADCKEAAWEWLKKEGSTRRKNVAQRLGLRCVWEEGLILTCGSWRLSGSGGELMRQTEADDLHAAQLCVVGDARIWWVTVVDDSWRWRMLCGRGRDEWLTNGELVFDRRATDASTSGTTGERRDKDDEDGTLARTIRDAQ